MFEAQIARGVKYLDKDLGPSWVERISLEELDLVDCYYCVIGQLYGDFFDAFYYPGDADMFGFHLRYHAPGDYAQLTKEWKEKVAQLKAERTISCKTN